MIKLALPAGKANPAPPVGPALGAKGVNIMQFCKEYNAATQDKAGTIIPVEITVYEDRSFTFVLKTPPASVLLKKAAGVETGSGEPNRKMVGKVTAEQVREIAAIKLPDLNCEDLEAAARTIAGTARNMGITVEGAVSHCFCPHQREAVLIKFGCCSDNRLRADGWRASSVSAGHHSGPVTGMAAMVCIRALNLCPPSPNCISTAEEANDLSHYVPAWSFNPEDGRGRTKPVMREQAMEELVEVVSRLKPDGFTPTIVERRPNYLALEYESPTFGFIDDVEFYFPESPANTVEYRSASRIGESDGDINRKRIKAIRLELQKKGWRSVGF
eukprot:scaffold17.g451.t1